LFSDSAELLFLSERFAHIEDAELRTENIKRRISLMQKFVSARAQTAPIVVSPAPKKVEIIPTPPPEPVKEEEKQEFSFYKKADAGSDLIEQLRQKEAMRAELAATVSKTMTKYK
tara:strand:+ start:158 stop:502 length:345 start_codon:yes stop_codon:yes gene_type:complete